MRALREREYIPGRRDDRTDDRYYLCRETWPTRSKAAYEEISGAWEAGWECSLPELRRRLRFYSVGLIRVAVMGAGIDGWPLEYTVEVPRTFPGAKPYWRMTVDGW